MSVERQTGQRPIALDGPALPPDAAHVWAWFLALHAARGADGFGPNPLSWADLAAWSQLTGTIVRPGEIEAIMLIDRLWLDQKATETAPPTQP